MKVQRNLSMQVVLEKRKVSKDGRLPIAIRLTIGGRRKVFYLGINIHPEQFHHGFGLARGHTLEAKAINKVIKQSSKSVSGQLDNVLDLFQHPSQDATKKYLNGLTLKNDSHEDQ